MLDYDSRWSEAASLSDDLVDDANQCPGCREQRVDYLVWIDNGDYVECQTCGAHYDPNEED